MTTYYVGLDVHSKQSAVAIKDEAGKVIDRIVVEPELPF